MRTFAAFILLLLLPAFASAFCFEEAGATYGVSPLLLWSIAKHESNMNPSAVGRNSNGTYDYGLMQINSTWAGALGRSLWMSLGDPCTNVKTGAWILSRCIRRHGYNWKAVGCYNSNTPRLRTKYAVRIAAVMKQTALPPPSATPRKPLNIIAPDTAANADPWQDVFGRPM